MSLAQRRGWWTESPIVVDSAAVRPPLSAGQALLGLARSSLYYRPREASGENLAFDASHGPAVPEYTSTGRGA